ncbi:MAG: monovalent cation/H+ antiporter subunit A [Rhodoferax sp.]
MNLWVAILAPLLGAALLAWMPGRARWVLSLCTAAVMACSAVALVPAALAAWTGQVVIAHWAWIPSVGLSLSLRFDGLGLLFAGLILGIGWLVVLYAAYYLSASDSLARLYAKLLLFTSAMLGVVLSENLLLLLVFWELTSLSSFLLISYWHQRPDARRGALMALSITGAGGLALLAGVLLLGSMAGGFELSTVLSSGDRIRAHALYGPALALILLGVWTKSAHFPFHFWLPNAMAAPTPVSAFLHSATMVKAGVFLLARLFPALAGTPQWTEWVGGVGLLTLLVGSFLALFQHDLKGLLAYSTISHLGLISALLGIGTPLAAVAGVFHIINHAIFKASLFMAAGIIDHECGTRDMRRINGLWRFMPYTAVLAMVASAAMAGVPLLNGFLSKELFFAEAFDARTQWRLGWFLPIGVTVAGLMAVAYSWRFVHDVFFNGNPVGLERTPHEPPRWMRLPVEILVALCLFVGIFPAQTVEPILLVASTSVLQGPPPDHDLAIWHGVSPALIMSLVALIGGSLLYWKRQPLFDVYTRWFEGWSADRWFDSAMASLRLFSRHVTRHVTQASVARQLSWLLLCALGLGLWAWLGGLGSLTGSASLLPMDGTSVMVTLGLVVASIATVHWHRQRPLAVVMASAVGVMVSLYFVRLSAPDLALTQISVEVVTMVLLMLALNFLPHQAQGGLARRAAWPMAAAVGTGTAAAAWAMMTRPNQGFSSYFIQNSETLGGGRNVVNVILVDFRGFDTFGEITVLALAGLGMSALLGHIRARALPPGGPAQPRDPHPHPLVLRSFAQWLLPVGLLVAFFIFLRGHHLPGGGFIAGLITSIALVIQYLAHGLAWSEARMPRSLETWIGAGLLLALLTGLGSWIWGYPFLTSTVLHPELPVLGGLELASAMAFDLGVFAVVVSSTLMMLSGLGRLQRDPGSPQREGAPKSEKSAWKS